MNKRAEEIFPPSKILAYILFGIFSAVSIIFLLLIYNSMTSSTYTVPEGLEDFLVLEYVTKSPSCFTYQDQYTGNIHWLSFDAGKLDSKHFTSCFQTASYGKTVRVGFMRDGAKQEIFPSSFSTKKFAEVVQMYPDTEFFLFQNQNSIKSEITFEVQG